MLRCLSLAELDSRILGQLFSRKGNELISVQCLKHGYSYCLRSGLQMSSVPFDVRNSSSIHTGTVTFGSCLN